MRAVIFTLLFAGMAAAQTVNCNSLGLEDGYQGHNWRATTKDCATATNKLEDHFGEEVPTDKDGCVTLSEAGDCRISYCYARGYGIHVDYGAIWAAARIVHGRHKHDGKVGAYVSLDDYWVGYKGFVVVAKKNPVPPQNMKRMLESEGSPLERIIQEEISASGWNEPADIAKSEGHLVERFVTNSRTDTDRADVPQTNLYVNIQTRWGGSVVTYEEMQDARDRLIYTHRDARRNNDRTSSLRPAGWLGRFNVMYEMEWVAHNNHDIRAINEEEMLHVIEFGMRRRLSDGDERENFIMQVRRGAESIGHLLIRAFRTQIPGVCQV